MGNDLRSSYPIVVVDSLYYYYYLFPLIIYLSLLWIYLIDSIFPHPLLVIIILGIIGLIEDGLENGVAI